MYLLMLDKNISSYQIFARHTPVGDDALHILLSTTHVSCNAIQDFLVHRAAYTVVFNRG